MKLKPLEAFKKAKTWQRKSMIIYQYHSYKLLHANSWNMRKTAKYFTISLGFVSESLLLIRHMQLIGRIKARAKALRIVRGL